MHATVDTADRTLTVEEFLAEYTGREGKVALVDGRVIELRPEMAHHARPKHTVARGIERTAGAVGRRLVPMSDGPALGTRARLVRVPDILVVDEATYRERDVPIPAPLIAVQILSDPTARTDTGPKVRESVARSSLTDCLIVDADERLATHRCRQPDGTVATRVVGEDDLGLAAGVCVDVSQFRPPRS